MRDVRPFPIGTTVDKSHASSEIVIHTRPFLGMNDPWGSDPDINGNNHNNGIGAPTGRDVPQPPRINDTGSVESH